MSFTNDRQPLVPPGLKRFKNELKCHGAGPEVLQRPEPRRARYDYSATHHDISCPLQDVVLDPEELRKHADEKKLKREISQTTKIDRFGDKGEHIDQGIIDNERVDPKALQDVSWSTILPDSPGTPSKKLPKTTEQRASSHPPRSSLQGFLAQFTKFTFRHNLFERLTLALGNIFGRICSRRRNTNKTSAGNNSDVKGTSDEDDAVSVSSSVTTLRRKKVQKKRGTKYQSVDSDCATAGSSDEDLLEEFGFSKPMACSSMLDPAIEEKRAVDSELEDDIEIDLGDGEASRDMRTKPNDQCSLQTRQNEKCFSAPPNQRRARWTMLSPLGLLQAVKARKDGHQQLKTTHDLDQSTLYDEGCYGPLEILDMTNSATTESYESMNAFCDSKPNVKQSSTTNNLPLDNSQNSDSNSSNKLEMSDLQDPPSELNTPVYSPITRTTSEPTRLGVECSTQATRDGQLFVRDEISSSCVNLAFCADELVEGESEDGEMQEENEDDDNDEASSTLLIYSATSEENTFSTPLIHSATREVNTDNADSLLKN